MGASNDGNERFIGQWVVLRQTAKRFVMYILSEEPF